MSWKAVDVEMPKQGEHLCMVKFWRTMGTDPQHGYGSAITTSVNMILSCGFDPKRGWSNILLNNMDFEVMYWMPIPQPPEDCIPMSKLFPSVI